LKVGGIGFVYPVRFTFEKAQEDQGLISLLEGKYGFEVNDAGEGKYSMSFEKQEDGLMLPVEVIEYREKGFNFFRGWQAVYRLA
jgi:hypothetical protein